MSGVVEILLLTTTTTSAFYSTRFFSVSSTDRPSSPRSLSKLLDITGAECFPDWTSFSVDYGRGRATVCYSSVIYSQC